MLGEATTTLGRDPASDIFLDDVTVSRHQAEIHRRGSCVTVADTNSFNGTYLNGVRLEGEARLTHGDELQLGRFKILFLEP